MGMKWGFRLSCLITALLLSFIGAVHYGGSALRAETASLSQDDLKAIHKAVGNNQYRKEADHERDGERHPAEFMIFLGLKPTMHVGEINPGGEWYSRILAPYLKEKGKYIGLEHHPDLYASAKGYASTLRGYPDKMQRNRDMFGPRAMAAWIPTPQGLPVQENSVDAIITVRSLHNWVRQGFFDEALDQVWHILKPDGVFGIIQHRADETFEGSREDAALQGRWKQSDMIAAIEAAGFKLVATSEMNANPKDTKDYPHGVWTLPPSLVLGDQDREKYEAIGESDRMTLKFVKIPR